jgi:hypothetical protein
MRRPMAGLLRTAGLTLAVGLSARGTVGAAALVARARLPTTDEQCPGAPGNSVHFSGHPAATAVVFDQRLGGVCRVDAVCAGSDNVTVPASGPVQDCPSQFAAFAPPFRPVLMPWPPPDEVHLDSALRLLTAIWVVTADSLRARDETLALNLVEEANRLFSRLAAGLELTVGQPQWDAQDSRYDPQSEWYFVRVGSAADAIIGRGCSRADSLPTKLTPAGGTAYRQGLLNIYFVPGGLLEDGSHDGMACWLDHPEVIYLTTLGSVERLAHEVGHSMGLINPRSNWGHPDTIAGFDSVRYNLMYARGYEVRNISLGQIYRIHFDQSTWRPISSRPPPENSRSCPDDAHALYPCPPLGLRPSGKWP